MSTSFSTESSIEDLIAQWKMAKNVEKQWTDYRRSIEGLITEKNKNYQAARDVLSCGTTMSKTVKVGDLDVKVASELVIDQAKAAEFWDSYPDLHGIILKRTFEPATTKAVLTAVLAKDSALGKEVSEMVTRKDNNPGYSHKG